MMKKSGLGLEEDKVKLTDGKDECEIMMVERNGTGKL